ncbi:MAG: hypothetical protein COB30_007575 [Ectothiorhodospiraceae bacterium]|nr:hypothetical protein [Ectothiorhodospiraceae bacterium]
MDERISPKYTHEKLGNPSTEDLIDVFDDIWRSYMFEPGRILLDSPNGSVAAMLILCSYYEAIESLYTGLSSRSKSQAFFIKGFARVFSAPSGIEKVAKEIYNHVRCGLVHEGVLRSKVHYSNDGHKAFFLTYPKNSDGSLDTTGPSESIIVNPERMYSATLSHFENYVDNLRLGTIPLEVKNFELFVMSQYDVGSGESIIGMTYDEFVAKA